MLLDGEAKLVDFGLAKMSEHSTMGTSVQGMRRVVQRGPWTSNRKSLLVTHRNHRNLQLDEPRAGKADECSRVAVARCSSPSPRSHLKQFTARVQATSAARKNYTLCDMFAFGLIVKWLIVGDATDVPFAGLPADQIIRVHGSLESSGGTMVHPFIADLSRVPPVFRPLIQARTPPHPPTPNSC
jgi:hypothetical protein